LIAINFIFFTGTSALLITHNAGENKTLEILMLGEVEALARVDSLLKQ
jgi:hypothetical protein